MVSASPAAGSRRPSRGTIVRVFLLAFVVYAYFMPRWADWNIDSRLDLVHAIVDGHTLRIDKYHQNTWDKAVLNGHYYSDKAPGTALMGAAVYGGFVLARSAPVLGGAIQALERNSAWNVAISLGRSDTQAAPAAKGRVLGGCQRTGVAGNVQYIPWGNRLVPPFQDWALSKYIVTVGVDALISALFAAFFFWFISLFVRRTSYIWLLTGLFAFATVALPYSTVFYSHQIVAGFLFVAFALLFLRARGLAGRWVAPAVGFLLGLSLLTEYTVGPIIVVIGLYAIWTYRRNLPAVGGLCLAGAVPVAALCAYNYASFGSVFDTGYTHDFCWSAAQAAGFEGFTTPQLGPLLDLTIRQYRGLFFMSPFLFLAVPGLVFMYRRGLKLEAVISLVIAAGFILLLSAYWGWNGGRVDGPRYLVPIVPFLAFPIAFLLDGLEDLRTRSIRGAFSVLPRRIVYGAGLTLIGVLSALSVFITWALFLGGELFPISWLRDPLTQYSLPQLGGNQIAPNAGFFLGLSGWESLIPLILLVAIITAWPRRREEVRVSRLTRHAVVGE